MRLFRMSLYSTWENITDPKERTKKAEELKNKRKLIHDEYTKRTGLGYGAKKVYDHQKKKNANQEVQRKIWNGDSKKKGK